MKFLWPEALALLATLPILAILYLRRPRVRMAGIVAARPARTRWSARSIA